LPESLPESVRDDAELLGVVTAWSDLPQPVRVGIAAMVKAATGAESGEKGTKLHQAN